MSLQTVIDKLKGKLTLDTRKLDMEVDEYCKFQELKSLAVANGTISLETGMEIYGYLGESPGTFNNQPIEVKAVLTQVFHHFLKLRIKGKL